MNQALIIRHGQAQTGAKDEASYDKLSPLGHQQAAWLGGHFGVDHGFSRVISGSLTRQRETAESMGLTGIQHDIDPRLNEMRYFDIAQSLKNSKGIDLPANADEFVDHVPQVLAHWESSDLAAGLETYAEFSDRITGALEDILATDEPIAVVSSTGVVATLAAISLGLKATQSAPLFLNVIHTSLHRFTKYEGKMVMAQYCATPHLDLPDRVFAKTYV